jgi:hypothetical protein
VNTARSHEEAGQGSIWKDASNGARKDSQELPRGMKQCRGVFIFGPSNLAMRAKNLANPGFGERNEH